MNLYESLGVLLCPNVTVSIEEWIYYADGFPVVICDQVGPGWGGKQG